MSLYRVSDCPVSVVLSWTPCRCVSISRSSSELELGINLNWPLKTLTEASSKHWLRPIQRKQITIIPWLHPVPVWTKFVTKLRKWRFFVDWLNGIKFIRFIFSIWRKIKLRRNCDGSKGYIPYDSVHCDKNLLWTSDRIKFHRRSSNYLTSNLPIKIFFCQNQKNPSNQDSVWRTIRRVLKLESSKPGIRLRCLILLIQIVHFSFTSNSIELKRKEKKNTYISL